MANIYGAMRGGWYLVYKKRGYFVGRSVYEYWSSYYCLLMSQMEIFQRIRERTILYDHLRSNWLKYKRLECIKELPSSFVKREDPPILIEASRSLNAGRI